VEVDVESEGIPEDLGEEYKICIYRLTQEALNNVARHSGGRHAWVSIRRDPGKISLVIRDDGHGFDPTRAKGLGLLGMEERVRRLRGTFRVESKPGEGTTLSAELPLA
jgi:signal transduction histidine kinase